MLRASGTEPVVRVMVEADLTSVAEKYANLIAQAIRDGAKPSPSTS